MSTISLRAYNREIDSYIDQSRLDEAIAHCRHILSKFPKHIATYRILGKAYLENNQNSNAADIFQRVLSAVPDDFISHVGMSVIREEEGNLAASVLHMEKAFEKQPYNSEIQIELRRLYGKRDGIEPPKVRLTQGALARMYIRGDQIQLGIAELRTAIGENPERYDLKTLLAETYLIGDQLANAIDLASDILKKYPFNLIANRIMAKTLKTHDHPQEMAICRKRLYALSPYEAYFSEHASTLEQVPDRAITIDQIEWDETQQNLPTKTRESRLPWSSPHGRTDPSQRIRENENIPDWLSPTTREKETTMVDENTGASMPEDQSPNPKSNDQNDIVPDWMQEAGWEKSSGTVDESKPVFDGLDDEDEIVPAEIPSWLEDAAPEGYSFEPEPTSDQEKAEVDDQSQALIDDDMIPISPQEDLDSDLSVGIESPSEQASDDAEKPQSDVPSWFENLKLDEDSQETAVAWLENMPESLRATADDEPILDEIPAGETSDLEQPSDEFGWTDDFSQQGKETIPDAVEVDAELSDDLVASELIPERQAEDKLFDPEEIDSLESDVPTWLEELGTEEESAPPAEQTADITESGDLGEGETPLPSETEEEASLMPDWLSEIESEEDLPEAESPLDEEESIPASQEGADAIPDWLGDYDSDQKVVDFDSESDSLAWLESLAEKQGAPEEELLTTQEERAKAQAPDSAPPSAPAEEIFPDVSPTDDTLSTEIPDWLSKIGDQEEDLEDQVSEKTEIPSETQSDDSSSWVDQIKEAPYSDSGASTPEEDIEVLEWLEGLEEQAEASPVVEEIKESPKGDFQEETPATEGETTETIIDESLSESMPDWLAELDTEGQGVDSTLESAIRQSDHPLTDEEKNYLDRVEEVQDENADWLAKLDEIADQTPGDAEAPAITVDIPEVADEEDEIDQPDAVSVSGGILDRLKDPEEVSEEPEVPQWLENLKKEEDPQETAILWLKQFVAQGDNANLNEEIKRYTDEIDPGDTVPGWMEDLKHEEDPQTTAMLWLEKLSGDREEAPKPKPRREEPEEAGWLAKLEKEEIEQAQEITEDDAKEFRDSDEGWLADLEIDEKLKSREEDEMPERAQVEGSEGIVEEGEETPPWMVATSPLEGDYHTDELAGNVEKEVEIPAWLAGYTEEEEVKEKTDSEIAEPDTESEPSELVEDQDEYAWVSASDEPPKATRELIDLNKAAISQLESILGISFQIAKGIVTYREKQGPYQSLEDLLNVPDITDEQTIEILKPEVFIEPVKEKPKPAKKSEPVGEEEAEARLAKARSLLADSEIEESLEHYAYLILKKKSLQEVVEDLIQAAYDHPMDVAVMKTLGDAYMQLDKLEEALDAYSKAEDLLR